MVERQIPVLKVGCSSHSLLNGEFLFFALFFPSQLEPSTPHKSIMSSSTAKAILQLSKWSNPNFFTLAKKEKKAQVLSIAFSHYCELAVWALQASSVPLHEHGYAPMQHVLPVLSVRVAQREKYLSASSRVTKVGELPTSTSTSTSTSTAATGTSNESAAATATAATAADLVAFALLVMLLKESLLLYY